MNVRSKTIITNGAGSTSSVLALRPSDWRASTGASGSVVAVVSCQHGLPGPVDGLGGLVGAGCPGADRRAEMGGQVGVVALDPVDGVVDAGGDRLAGALAVVAEPAAAAAQSHGVGELADERVAFGDGAGGPFEVVAGGGVVDVLVEFGQPGFVGGAGLVVEDGVGPGGGYQAGELCGAHWFAGLGEKGGDVAEAFGVRHADGRAAVGDIPERAVALEPVERRRGPDVPAEPVLLQRAQLRPGAGADLVVLGDRGFQVEGGGAVLAEGCGEQA